MRNIYFWISLISFSLLWDIAFATITYNTQYVDINNAYFYDDSAGNYTARGNDGHNIDYFNDDSIAGDYLFFQVKRNDASKFNEVKFNVLTPLVASSITVIWEYAKRNPAGGWDPTWHSLAGVVDNTNVFQNAGVNSVTFTCPEDWQNYVWVTATAGTYYSWLVRCRIVSTTALTEGGKQTADAVVVNPNTIWISNFSEGTPCTMQDIYDEDVLQGWGVVNQVGNAYDLNCGLNTNSSTGYFTTKQEVIQFLKNWDCWFWGVIKSGEVVSGNKCKNGSEFIFNLYNGDLGGRLAYTNAEIYNTHYRYIHMSGSSVYHGHWGGSLGSASGQKIYDIYGEGLRQFAFSYDSNVIIGAKGYGFHVESPGAILKNITCYGGSYSVRPNLNNDNDYMHECDFSGCTTAPINPWQATRTEFVMNYVDCNWGTFEKSHYAKWQTLITHDYFQSWIWETYSFLLKLIDKDNNAISGATVILKDKDGAEVFSYTTNADGAPGQDSGTASSATASTIIDTSKSWTSNQWWFKEVYITSGKGIGQRRIIKKGNTATELQVAPDWDTTPDATSKYIIIPYVRATQILSPETEPVSGSHWSLVVDKNPFTITISKKGYLTYKKSFTLDEKINWRICLKHSPYSNIVGIE